MACLAAAMATAGAFAEEQKPGSGQTTSQQVVRRPLADLAVTSIGFARIQLDPNAAPRKCYGYLFTYTIKNIGNATASNFYFQAEVSGQSGVYGISNTGGPVTLKPGESLTHAPAPPDQQYWCLDDTWKSKVKVTADTGNAVQETNKANNVREKTFSPFQFKPVAVEKKK